MMDEFNFHDATENMIELAKRPVKITPADQIHPSSLGKCLRLLWHDRMYPGSFKPDMGLKQIFLYGNIIHDEVAFPFMKEYVRSLDDKNIMALNEYPFRLKLSDNTVASGYVDTMIQITTDQEVYFIPIEIKSYGGSLRRLTSPSLQYLIQVMSYIGMFRADFGYLVYIHKGTLDSKTFKIDFDEVMYKNIVERAEQFHEYLITGIMPPAESMNEHENGNKWYTKLDMAEEDEKPKKHPCNGCDLENFCKKNRGIVHPEEE